MNHQLNSFSWDVLGSTLCLPQAVSHAGWVLTNVEARSANGSSESLSSKSSAGTLHSSNDFIEDVLYSQSFFDDGLHSPVSFTTGPEETANFDFNFLPSSPESIDFMHLGGSGIETLPLDLESVSDMLMDRSSNTIKISPTPENIKVEQAVEDPDVALKLLQQLSTNHINNDVPVNLVDPPSIRNNLDARFIPLNILPVGDASFIPSQTLAASPAFEFASVAPANVVSFHVDNFFASPHDSHHKVTPLVNTVLVSSQNANAFTLRDLVSMSDVKQATLPSSPAVSQNSAFTMDSISFEDIVVPQQSKPLVIRPEKRQRKKEQNKNAAQKYRQKKRIEQGSFFSECQETEKKNSELKLRVNEITREINYLKGLLLEISVA